MRSFEELVTEAGSADITGWGFGWLNGRATEERPPWGYSGQLAQRLARAHAALDIETGGGEVIDEAPRLPRLMAVTEAWPPNLLLAKARLEPRGVQVVQPASDGLLPFPGATFDLVTGRHPVNPPWAEIARVLQPGGTYFAQHVGPRSAIELIEFFRGPQPHAHAARAPEAECQQAKAAGLTVIDLQAARCRMEFFDIGAVVWVLRKLPWWVPDFSVAAYESQLRALDARIRAEGPFVAYSTRHLIEATRR